MAGNALTISSQAIQYSEIKPATPNLVNVGMDLFFKFSPIDRNETGPDRVYRSFNWGKYFDLFLLDAHSYRSINTLDDTLQNNKTLYGKQQLEWLKNNILSSNAT